MTQTSCGYVALLGAPNAGKSTLLNALIGSDLSIVTAKPQTTRGRILGITGIDNAQLIFVDTPGIFEAKPKFEMAMVEAAWRAADDADIILIVVDAARGLDDDTKRIMQAAKLRSKPVVLVLNKTDKVDKPVLPELAKACYEQCEFARSFMVCAKRGDGVKDILQYLASQMPQAPWLYADELTDMNERQIAAEITREQCFNRVHAELPYNLMVETEKWEEKMQGDKRVLRISQIIIVSRESHKKIILGKSGAMLKAIGMAARRKMGGAFEASVHLFLFVKVREMWKDEPEMFKAAGLEYKP